jgi:hypothetical protein
MKLIGTVQFNEKIRQIYETILVRHGVIIIGESISGKTASYKALAKTFDELNQIDGIEKSVNFEIINPKSMLIDDLYGRFDTISSEWFDGVLTHTFRHHSLGHFLNNDNQRKWIIFDGPIDSAWVENMNTVLDDNKKLCLLSGEVIRMSPNQTMLFELSDLDQAAPSTISRCSIIYFEPSIIGTRSLIDSWLKWDLPSFINDKQAKIISSLCDWLVEACLDFVITKCDQFIKCSRMHLLMSFIKLYNCMLHDIWKKFEDEFEELETSPDNNNNSNNEPDDDEYTNQKTAIKQRASINKSENLSEDDEYIPNKNEPDNHPKISNVEEKNNMIIAYFFISIIWSISGVVKLASRDKFNNFFLQLIHDRKK